MHLLVDISFAYQKLDREFSPSGLQRSAFAMSSRLPAREVPALMRTHSRFPASDNVSELTASSSSHSVQSYTGCGADEFVVDFPSFNHALGFHEGTPSTASIQANTEAMRTIYSRDARNGFVDLLNLVSSVSTGTEAGSWFQSQANKLTGMDYKTVLYQHIERIQDVLHAVDQQLIEIKSIHIKSSEILASLPRSLTMFDQKTLTNEIKINQLLIDRVRVEKTVISSTGTAVQQALKLIKMYEQEVRGVLDKMHSLNEIIKSIISKVALDVQDCLKRIEQLPDPNDSNTEMNTKHLIEMVESFLTELKEFEEEFEAEIDIR